MPDPHTFIYFMPSFCFLYITKQTKRYIGIEFIQDYDISIVNNGIDRRHSMLVRGPGHTALGPGHRRRRSSGTGTFSTTQREQRSRRRRSATLEALQQEEGAEEQSRGAAAEGVGPVSTNHTDTDTGGMLLDGRDGDDKFPASKVDHDMNDLTSSMSALKFVPSSVRFGRGKKGGLMKS